MSDEKEINIKLSPFLALQILRLKPFVLVAIEDDLNSVSELDKHATYELYKEMESQVMKQISQSQIEDAKATKEVKSLIYNPNKPKKNG